jgi:hypothetical protein
MMVIPPCYNRAHAFPLDDNVSQLALAIPTATGKSKLVFMTTQSFAMVVPEDR